MQRTRSRLTRFFGICFDIFSNAVDQRMSKPLFNRPFAPAQILRLRFLGTAVTETFCNFEQPFGRVITTVQHHIFAGFTQFWINRVIDRQLAGIDDTHIHANLNGMIKEDSVHRFAHRLITAEREGQV